MYIRIRIAKFPGMILTNGSYFRSIDTLELHSKHEYVLYGTIKNSGLASQYP